MTYKIKPRISIQNIAISKPDMPILGSTVKRICRSGKHRSRRPSERASRTREASHTRRETSKVGSRRSSSRGPRDRDVSERRPSMQHRSKQEEGRSSGEVPSTLGSRKEGSFETLHSHGPQEESRARGTPKRGRVELEESSGVSASRLMGHEVATGTETVWSREGDQSEAGELRRLWGASGK